jgi:hypothetical protein
MCLLSLSDLVCVAIFVISRRGSGAIMITLVHSEMPVLYTGSKVINSE